jgi:very-short-patch-repair endonuclease
MSITALDMARSALLSLCLVDCAVSHHVAAMIHKLLVPQRFMYAGVSVTLPRGKRRPHRDDLHLHTAALLSKDVVEVPGTGVWVTSVARTLVDFCRMPDVTEFELAVCVEDALRRKLVTYVELRTALERMKGKPYTARARAIIVACSEKTESRAETKARLIIKKHVIEEPTLQLKVELQPSPGIVPAAQRPLPREAHLDFAFPEHMLVVEIDGGPFHSDPIDIDYDQRRDRQLALQGWRILRFPASTLNKPKKVAARINAELQR